jgi:putative two-component system response regulator
MDLAAGLARFWDSQLLFNPQNAHCHPAGGSELSARFEHHRGRLFLGGAMSAPPSHKGIILVADDDEGNRELLSEMLTAEGYQVVSAADGRQALARVNSDEIDLALLDVVMPLLTGFEICQKMKSNPETRLIPVILLTGLTSDSDRLHGIMCDADDYLNKPIKKHELLARVHSLLRLKQFTDELDNAEMVLFSLALTIEAKDPYTEGHCDRLSKYSVALGEKLGLPQDLRLALRRGGLIHDIGKLAVPESILLKPGPLTPEERKIMEQHTIEGERICMPLRSFRNVLPIIRHHHEKQDGSGYPDGLKGSQVPLTARILQITDIYDALTTDRPYRKALSTEKAFAIMREEVKRGWWDGSILDEFEGGVRDQELVHAAGSRS